MRKRFLIFFVLLTFLFSLLFPLTAFCNNQDDTGSGLIAFAYDTMNNIVGMSYSEGDSEQRLIDYIKSSGQAFGWKYLQYQTDQLANTPVPVLANRLFDVQIENPVGDFAAEKYHAAVVNRDYVDSIYDSSNQFIRSGNINGLQNYGITTTASINYDQNIIAHPPFYNPTNEPTGYIDITSAVNYNGVSVLSGPGIAPVMYVPDGIDVYLYDRLLPQKALYILISDNYLYYCPCYDRNYINPRTSILLYTYDNGSGKSFEMGAGFFEGYNGDYVQLSYWFNEYVQIVTSSSTTTIPQYSNDTLSYIAEYQSHMGDSVLAEYPEVEPPSTIPYDDDDNIVIFIPSDRQFEPSEIIYYNPEVVKTFIDDRDIITYDYSTNLDQRTYNDVVNNYYNYIDNSGGSSFDDSNILGKFDGVIGWLRRMYNVITLKPVRENPKFKIIFSDQPSYIHFSDCLVNNLPIISEISTALETVKTNQTSTGFEAPLYTAPENPNILQKLFDGFTFDISWYAPYRQKVYDLLTGVIYCSGVITCLLSVKSVFGVRNAGGDE